MYRYKILSQLINMYPLINVGFGKFFPKNNKRVYTTIRGTRVVTIPFTKNIPSAVYFFRIRFYEVEYSSSPNSGVYMFIIFWKKFPKPNIY